MTRSVDDLSDPLLRLRLRADGYAYLDADGNHIGEPPAMGWYVSLDDDGVPRALRLSNTPVDGVHAHRGDDGATVLSTGGDR